MVVLLAGPMGGTTRGTAVARGKYRGGGRLRRIYSTIKRLNLGTGRPGYWLTLGTD